MTTVYALAGSSQTNVGVTNPANVFANDGAFASFDSNSDTITVTGFAAQTGDIGRVRLCVWAKRAGVANAQFTVSYELSGVPSGSSGTLKFTSPTKILQHIDVTNDRAWSWTDVTNLGIKLAGQNLGGTKLGDVDQIFVEVTTHNTGPLTGGDEGKFRTFIINSTPMQVVSTPVGVKNYNINILNHDRNTDYVYISHDNTVSATNGWELMPTAPYITACDGATEFWVVSPNATQEITVSMHEV